MHTNDAGFDIMATDYWSTPEAARGRFFVSTTDDTFRLLVPPTRMEETKEWLVTEFVIVSRGRWPARGKSDGLEILFEDHTDTPYVIHLAPESIDKMPHDADQDQNHTPPRWRFAVWTPQGKLLEFPCRYRRVEKIPYIKGW